MRTLYEPGSTLDKRQVLDSAALILYFPGPRTATGEDVLELHVHGGPAVVKAVLAAIPRTVLPTTRSSPLVRYAEPGEFTRRAFYNDRLDLTQIEALGDTLSAETEQQRRLAINGTSNTLSKRYESWREQLLYARGELEALIDFSEDQHFEESPANLVSSVAKQVDRLRGQIDGSIKNAARGELLRSGINIALLGAPNAGKSSLLNRIAGREAAIVSQEAGTTRDVVEINLDIGGYFCKFGDLAGLRGSFAELHLEDKGVHPLSIGEVEQEGIRRAKERVMNADVIIVVLPIEEKTGLLGRFDVRVDSEISAILKKCNHPRQRFLIAVNKIDLVPRLAELDISNIESLKNIIAESNLDNTTQPIPHFPISCKSASAQPTLDFDPTSDPGGIQVLLNGLISTFQSMTDAVDNETTSETSSSPWEESLGASERQRLLLLQCYDKLHDFLTCVSYCADGQGISNHDTEDLDIVLAAENLRAAADCLAKVTGKGEAGDVEEVLGVVFEK